MQDGAAALDFFEDVARFGGPDERLGPLIVTGDVALDGGDEFVHTAKDAAAKALGGEIAKESLDHVQPRRRGGVKWT